MFDDPHSGAGEGYAIDFVRLLVNPNGGGTTPAIRTVFRENFDTLTDVLIDGQNECTSSGSGNTIRITLDSTSNLGGRVADGLDNPRSANGP
ncbi:hypothetical protein OAL27_01845 [Verrucomicrobiales bacterium]|nr:hypothetical protein [Verrucomicrobiales bacterium]MDF1785443.1 hypothetical protein [Verrucomicrobiales bacterium]